MKTVWYHENYFGYFEPQLYLVVKEEYIYHFTNNHYGVGSYVGRLKELKKRGFVYIGKL